jgi:hypothetical protein
MTEGEQLTFLKTKELPLASLEDLATAFVAHYVATGEPLFGWYHDSWSFVVRATGTALNFDSYGLVEYVIGDNPSYRHVAVSARVPRIKN